MNSLKHLCLFFSLLLIVAATTGIQAFSTGTHGTTIARMNTDGRLWALANALILAIFAYGLHIRARITWNAGFILWTLGYLYFVIGAVTATYHAAPRPDFQSFWLPISVVVLVGGAITVYWGLWWKRQRAYFRQDQPAKE